MPAAAYGTNPGLLSFKKSIRNKIVPVETFVTHLITLLKRRQISGSRECAEATAYLLRRVVEVCKDDSVSKLIQSVQRVGFRLIAAQPKELTIGNIIRRVLGVIRDETEEDRDRNADFSEIDVKESRSSSLIEASSHCLLPSMTEESSAPLRQGSDADETSNMDGNDSQRRTTTADSLLHAVSDPISLFSPQSHPATAISLSESHNPSSSSQVLMKHKNVKDLRAEVVEGIAEILEELRQADDQIAGFALEHIHSNEIILTHTSSVTVQKFLLRAAAKRHFTVVHAEAYPNDHAASHATFMGKSKDDQDESVTTGNFHKALMAFGVTVILIPDSAVFAVMSRVNKVILDTHAVLANGALIAAAGGKNIAGAAKVHCTPVIVLSGIYKLSPAYPFDPDTLLEDGDPGKIIPYENGDFVGKVEVENPLLDYIPADLIDLYITNLGGHAPSYLYRVVADHYRTEDIDFDAQPVTE